MVKKTARAYLIGGEGFHRVFWPSLAIALALVHNTSSAVHWVPGLQEFWRGSYEWLLDRLMRGAHSMMWWGLFGLLSSSCCAVQLILNLFNFGCAGFNTYLGPLRPAFLALTISLQVKMWKVAIPNIGMPTTPDYFVPGIVGSSVFTAFLALLPEITDVCNGRFAAVPDIASSTKNNAEKTELVFSLEGLGCVACTSAVQRAVDKVTGQKLTTSAISLEKQEARFVIACSAEEAEKGVAPEIIEQIQSAGFEATLQSVGRPVETVTSNIDASQSGFIRCASAGHSSISALIVGLLSSSCCLLQLGLNLLSALNLVQVGCAGFNKVLGPVRSYLRVLTFAWLGFSWLFSLRRGQSRKLGRLVVHTTLCLTLTFLPELLRAAGGPALAPPVDGARTVNLAVDGMGCEACEAHVRGVIEQSPGVISGHVDFDKGTAEFQVAEDWGFDLPDLLRRLGEDSYESKVVEGAQPNESR